ncbi:MAG: succinate dehydrogenase assembly factor 2, partial [Janthinobacterium lividum]
MTRRSALAPPRHARYIRGPTSPLPSAGTRPSMTMPDEDAVRRRKIKFRAWHRGTKEMDLIMGRFADANLATL